MIESLELTNFMSVQYAKHTFSPGLNVVRGANEAGKSTRFLAVAYALWGARALPDSLEDTVTWGQPVSSLKVVLVFSVGGVRYTIVRTRNGAELSGGGTLSSGQAEVTARVEQITGASAATGLMTLLTNQGSLQASLDSASLIEKLSNTSLLDRLIVAVGDNFPSGNTKQLEIELGREVAKPVEPSGAEQQAVNSCEVECAAAASAASAAEAKLTATQPELAAAASLLEARANAERAIKLLRSQLKARLPTPTKPDEPRTLEELQESRAAFEGLVQKKRAWETFNRLPVVCHGGSLDWHRGQLALAKRAYQTLSNDLAQLTTKRAETKAAGIWADSCALCGKFLTDVPEVVAINAKVSATLVSLDSEIVAKAESVTTCKAHIDRLEELMRQTEIVAATLPSLSDYCSVDYDYTPPVVVWTAGGVQEVPAENYDKLINELQAKRTWYIKACAEVTAHNQQCDAIEQELATIVVPDTTEAEKTIAVGRELRAELDSANFCMLTASRNLTCAKHELDKAQSVFQTQMDAYASALSARAKLLQLLSEYRENNALLAKLKALKPSISKTLWSLVLLSVSTVFSQLRGVQSIVTRDSDGFLIDGKKARSYSGSTKDILGLAIRITLQKTFLPNLTFCLLDEPAAAADTAREEAMLAALSRVDFTQVLLVTHSDLADTFAQSVHVL